MGGGGEPLMVISNGPGVSGKNQAELPKTNTKLQASRRLKY